MTQPKLFERGSKVVAGENSLLRRQDELRAYLGCFFLAEFHLTLKFSRRRQPQTKYVRKHPSAKTQHDYQHNRKTTIHSFPLPLARLSLSPCITTRQTIRHPQAMHRGLPRTLLYQTTLRVKRESKPVRPIA